ncbi:MAG: NAD-dependent epimerase/dehydratase family protein [Lachnospiraceae bacterium]|nr:NAD-dependent epimerase/dehydratase family protein [Lachnospiraceae bacterium]
MGYLECGAYREDVAAAVRHTVNFEKFHNKKVLVLGASGLIGSFMTDCFLYANEEFSAGITIYAASRNRERLISRFGDGHVENLHFVEADVTDMDMEEPFDYMIHAASYGHPQAFRETPVEVLLSNVIGTDRILKMARQNMVGRVLYVSSGEVQEEVDHLSARACYPMGKRAAETLCISYNREYGVDVVMGRPCHTFGANVTKNDNRAATQFIMSAAQKRDIEMYSAGEQRRTFSYVADCVSGLLTVLTSGESGKVYGISSDENCTVREFAEQCAEAGECRVRLHRPGGNERAEMSPIANQIVKNEELKALGWQAAFSIREGITKAVQIMRETGGI